MSVLPHTAALPLNVVPPSPISADTLSLPVMLDHLAHIDVVALDAAVATGLPGERARRLLENRRRVAPERLPLLLLAFHDDEEARHAQEAAQRFGPLVSSVVLHEEKSRNETAVTALNLHRKHWPTMSEMEHKARVLLLARRGGLGKPELLAKSIIFTLLLKGCRRFISCSVLGFFLKFDKLNLNKIILSYLIQV